MQLISAEPKRFAMPAVTWLEAFISNLTEEAAKDRRRLNSRAQQLQPA